MTRLPFVTIVLAVACLAIAFEPGLQDALVLDRERVLNGEVWRILGGHFVHLSRSHLILNLTVFVLGGTLIEREDRALFVALCFFSAVAIGIGLLLVTPTVDTYAGASGVACALLVFACLVGLREDATTKWISVAMLAAIAAKVGLEATSPHALFARGLAGRPFAPSPAAHVFGALAAFATFATRASPRA